MQSTPALNSEFPLWVPNANQNSFQKHYVLGKLLGQPGQFAETYSCQHIKTGNLFAVKVIDKKKSNAKWVNCEINILKCISDVTNKDHNNRLSQLIDVYEDIFYIYLIIEQYHGGELFDIINNGRISNEKLVAVIIKQILQGLVMLHEYHHIIHGDLSLTNIMFADNIDKELAPLLDCCAQNTEKKMLATKIDELMAKMKVKIIDFGYSKKIGPNNNNNNNDDDDDGGDDDDEMSSNLPKGIIGTAHYIAPEIPQSITTHGSGYDYAVDMWSLGIITFATLLGYVPFLTKEQQFKSEKDELLALFAEILQGFVPEVRSVSKYGYGRWFPDTMPLSFKARDFISQLLTRDPKKRLTARQALNHPFITQLDDTVFICNDITNIETKHKSDDNYDDFVDSSSHVSSVSSTTTVSNKTITSSSTFKISSKKKPPPINLSCLKSYHSSDSAYSFT